MKQIKPNQIKDTKFDTKKNKKNKKNSKLTKPIFVSNLFQDEL